MPRKKKSQQEKLSEGFMPINPEDVKLSVEVIEKTKPEIEKVETTSVKSAEGRTAKAKKPRIKKPKVNGYTLIITEKPQAAMKIASALGNARKLSNNSVPYYELERGGEKIVVACAVGHLFNLTLREGKGYPVFDIEWSENWKNKKADFSKKYLMTLKMLAKDASEFVVATDYDIEGEVIGLNIIRFIAKQGDAKRMKFSTLTKEELEQAFDNRMKTLDWGQAIAGETRHKLDWFYGINLSRALMAALNKVKKFRIMSTGRVQGPALALIVDKEMQIQKFRPEDYWQVFIKVQDIILKYVKDITKQTELDKFKDLKGKTGDAKTEKKLQELWPQAPFDLTSLQIEAYKFFKIKPSQTLQIAQRLYLAGLISYPRTSSQKLPPGLQYKSILSKLTKHFPEAKAISRSKPVEGSKSDPAHPAIHPTGEFQELEGEDKKIYDLIVKRFIACFYENAKIENKTINFTCESLLFQARGMEIKESGWMDIYPSMLKEKELKDLNGKYKIDKLDIEKKLTQPPNRYSPASIVSELAKRNLGTKATRANIIDTLYARSYIQDTSIKATPLGISLIEAMKKYSPIIIDEKLTRHFEEEMDSIVTAKHNLEEKENKVIEEAKESIIRISLDMKKNEEKIGNKLAESIQSLYETEKENNKLNFNCPVCNKGQLTVKYSPKTKKSFIACTNYPECKAIFSLPPGFIKQTEKVCESCKFPMMMRVQKGKRPWIFCFNPQCPTNADWQKKKAEKASEN